MCEKQCADKHLASAASGERQFALSCPLNRVSFALLLGHRIFSVRLRHPTLVFAMRGSSATVESSGAPCTLPRSSAGWFSPSGCKNQAAPDPSRRIFTSDPRGSITSNPSWPRERATDKISCCPSSLVCTSPHPLAQSSSAQTTLARRRPPCSPRRRRHRRSRRATWLA